MQSQVFRIEKMLNHLQGNGDLDSWNVEEKHREILTAIQDVKDILSNNAVSEQKTIHQARKKLKKLWK